MTISSNISAAKGWSLFIFSHEARLRLRQEQKNKGKAVSTYGIDGDQDVQSLYDGDFKENLPVEYSPVRRTFYGAEAGRPVN